MIVVGVGEYNGGGSDPGARLEPIGPAIDHDAGAALSDEERAVAAVAARSCFDLAARAEEGEFDVVRSSRASGLSLGDRDLLLFLLRLRRLRQGHREHA